MKIFAKHLKFQPADPLGDGLREEIEAEKSDPEAIVLQDGIQEEAIANYWQFIEQDIQGDPNRLEFADAEE